MGRCVGIPSLAAAPPQRCECLEVEMENAGEEVMGHPVPQRWRVSNPSAATWGW